jgi:hypothetical protein
MGTQLKADFVGCGSEQTGAIGVALGGRATTERSGGMVAQPACGGAPPPRNAPRWIGAAHGQHAC